MMDEPFSDDPIREDDSGPDKQKSVKSSPRAHGHLDLASVKCYVETSKYPVGASESDKRTIRKRAKSFSLIDGVLYFKDVKGGNNDPPTAPERRVLFDPTEHRKAITECHIDSLGNHNGFEKTYSTVSAKYYWVGVCNTVKEFIKDCTFCSSKTGDTRILRTVKEENGGNVSLFSDDDVWSLSSTKDIFAVDSNNRPAAAFFWHQVELQILGPYSHDGDKKNYYVLVCLDLFSFWPEALVVEEVTSATLTHFLFSLICRYGIMKVLFISKPPEPINYEDIKIDPFVFKDILEDDLRIIEKTISAQELTSRIGRVVASVKLVLVRSPKLSNVEPDQLWRHIKFSLEQLIGARSDDWNHCIDAALLPYRISRPEREEYTPAYMLYRRELPLPSCLSHRANSKEYSSNADPHLNNEQMTASTEKLLQMFETYTRSLPKPSDTKQQEPIMIYVGSDRPVPEVRIEKLDLPYNLTQSEQKKSIKTKPASRKTSDSEIEKSTTEPVSENTNTRHRTRLSTGARKRQDVKSLLSKGFDARNEDKEADCIFMSDNKDSKKSEDEMISDINLDRVKKEPDHATFAMNKTTQTQELTKDTPRQKKICLVPSLKATPDLYKADDVIGTRYPEGTFDNRSFANQVDLDEYYHAVWMYKTIRKYPKNCSETLKRVMRRVNKNFKIEGDFMYYKWNGNWRKVIMKTEQRIEVMDKAHIDEEGLHVARKRLVGRLSDYYWRGITLDCEAFVKACPGCPHGNDRVSNQSADKSNDSEDLPFGITVEDILHYLKDKSVVPVDKIKAKELKKLENCFYLVDNELFYHPNKECDDKLRRVLFDDDTKHSALGESHVENGIHLSLENTSKALKLQYYWSGMLLDTQLYIQSCCDPTLDGEGGFEDSGLREKHRDQRLAVYTDFFQSKKKVISTKKRKRSDKNNSTSEDVRRKAIKSLHPKFCESQVDHHPAESQETTGSAARSMQTSSDEFQVDQVPMETQETTELVEKSSLTSSDEPRVDHYSVETQETTGNAVRALPTSSDEFQGDHGSIETQETAGSVEKSLLTSSNESQVDHHPVEILETTGSVDKSTVSTVPDAKGDNSSESFGDMNLKIINVEGNLNTTSEDAGNPDISSQESQHSLLDESISVSIAESAEDQTLHNLMVDEAIQSILPDSSSEITSKLDEDSADSADEFSETENMSDSPDDSPIKDEEIQDTTLDCSGKCQYCGLFFRGTRKLKAHLFKHTGKKQFKCEECGKSYVTHKTLMMHMTQHTGETQWLCDTCGKTFPRKAQLEAHLKVHSSDVQRCQWYTCMLCGVLVKSELRLQNHMDEVHSKAPAYYKCRICGASFTVRRSLKRHEKAHTGTKEHVCDFCGKQFLRKEYLTTHMARHLAQDAKFKAERKPRKSKTPQVEDEKIVIKQEVVEMEQDTEFAVKQITEPEQELDVKEKIEEQVVFPEEGQESVAHEQFIVHGEDGNRVILLAVPSEGEGADISQTQNVFFDSEGVQYEVECSDGTQLTEADLSAINLLAQASCYQ